MFYRKLWGYNMEHDFLSSSFNDAVNFWDYIASAVDELIIMEILWNSSEKENTEFLGEILRQYHFVLHKYHKHWTGIELMFPPCEIGV
jgi:hypothetical protein